MALGLLEEGLSGIRAYDVMLDDRNLGAQIHARAQEAQVELVPELSQLATWADVLFSAVPSSVDMDVCRSVCPCLRGGQLYVDVGASTPAVKRAIWERVKETGVLFVDAAMMGSLPLNRHRVPITASGNGAELFRRLMTPWGMRITTVGETAGDASAIKLIRSIFMKGISALMIETIQAADRYGVTGEVVDSIADSLDGTPFVQHLDRLVAGSAVHCRRRAAELGGSLDLLVEAGLPSDMTAAAKRSLERLEPYQFAGRSAIKKISTAEEVVAILRGAQ